MEATGSRLPRRSSTAGISKPLLLSNMADTLLQTMDRHKAIICPLATLATTRAPLPLPLLHRPKVSAKARRRATHSSIQHAMGGERPYLSVSTISVSVASSEVASTM